MRICSQSIASGWSNDGSKIIFQSNRTGSFEIYSMNLDGTSQQMLFQSEDKRDDSELFDDQLKEAYDRAKNT